MVFHRTHSFDICLTPLAAASRTATTDPFSQPSDMERLPISELACRFGDISRRIWLMAQGMDPHPVQTAVAPPKNIGHGKVMPSATRDREIILENTLGS